MTGRLTFITVFSLSFASVFIGALAPPPAQIENSAPIVRITAPLNKSRLTANALVNYSISVIDKEDGNSEFNEIASNEVLLKVVYLADSVLLKKFLVTKENTGQDTATLLLLIKSNCFTCHSVKNKLIGPSFEAIAKRYPQKPAAAQALMKKVLTGSKGVWGNTPMPAQPEINKEQLKEMLDWILIKSVDKNSSYYTGLEGAFRTNEHSGKGVYVLTASYTDHGLKNKPWLAKRGEHTIVLTAAAPTK